MFILALACGGSGGSGTEPPPPPVVVSVAPRGDTLTVGTSVQLAATVDGSPSGPVSWSVVGGTSAGSVTSQGTFTAGGTAGLVKVVATSIAQPAGSDTTRILVVAAPAGVLGASDSAVRNGAGLSAGIGSPSAGLTFLWSVTGGTITGGQGTAALTYSAGGGATVDVSCTLRNLADSAITVTAHTVLVPPPSIVSFSAAKDTLTVGQGTVITAVFSGGTAAVDGGVGAVTSGVAVPVGPFNTGYAGTTLTLSVTGFRGAIRSSSVKVVTANVPVLNVFRAIAQRVPVGGRGQFLFGYNVDPGVIASIDQGVGQVPVGTFPLTPVLTTPGPILFTASVRSPADSIVRDTTTLTVVTPAGGTFSASGTMHAPRLSPSATLLNNGLVLIAGGIELSGSTITHSHASAELYDPATGTFQLTDSLLTIRGSVRAFKLPSGKVLALGAAATSDFVSELYDPATGHWTLGPALPFTPVGTAQLTDGRVFFMAFNDGRAAIYDPGSGAIDVISGPAFVSSVVTSLPGNRVLVMESGSLAARVFDAGTQQFTMTGSMAYDHLSGQWTVLQSGKVLVSGGGFPGTNGFKLAEVYDPASGQWSVVGPMAQPRYGHSAILTSNGTVLIVNGFGEGVVRDAEVFDPATGIFTPVLGSAGVTGVNGTGVALPGGRVLLSGGQVSTGNGNSDRGELFVP